MSSARAFDSYSPCDGFGQKRVITLRFKVENRIRVLCLGLRKLALVSVVLAVVCDQFEAIFEYKQILPPRRQVLGAGKNNRSVIALLPVCFLSCNLSQVAHPFKLQASEIFA